MALNHIKPHGSLYGMAARLEEVAHAVCDAADVFKVPSMGMIGTFTRRSTPSAATMFAEFYADLDYSDDGSLIITREHEPRIRRTQRRGACAPSRKERSQVVGGKDVAGARRRDLRPLRHAECRRDREGGARGGEALSRRRLTVRNERLDADRTDWRSFDGDQANSLAASRHLLPQAGAGQAGLQVRGRQRSRSATSSA